MSHRHAIALLGLCAALGALAACDDVRFETESRSAQPPIFQPRTVRTLVSEAGLQAMYRVEHPAGVRLNLGARSHDAFGHALTLGPIDEQIEVDAWRVDVDQDDLSVGVSASSVEVVVAARIEEAVGARICRYSLAVDQVEMSTAAQLAPNGDGPQVDAVGQPSVTLSNPRVTRIGDCPPLADAEADNTFAVHQLFIDYLREAWRESSAAAVRVSPLDSIGLVRSPVSLERISPFENRRGALQIAGRLTPNNGSWLDQRGMWLDLDMAANSRRADCSPSLPPRTPGTLSADEVPTSELVRTGADVGLTIATPLMVRLAQTSVLAGFGCRGLEGATLDGSGTNLPTDALRLDDIGLDQLPVGPWVEPVIAPAELPDLTTNPAENLVELDWNDLSVDLYAEIQGVQVRIARLTVDTTIALRPVERINRIDLQIDSVYVADASLQSQWIFERPFDTDLTRWARRTVLLVLQDTFSLPLPLAPDAQLHLVESQVRVNDLLLLLEFDRNF